MMVNNTKLLLKYFCIFLLFMSQCSTHCGKEMYQVKRVHFTELTETRDFSPSEKINLAYESLLDIKGIEELPLEGCVSLRLQNNYFYDIKPLLKASSTTLKYLFLQNNKLKNITKEQIVMLQTQFPNLTGVNLRGNNIKIPHLKKIREKLRFKLKINKVKKHD